ncbi:hypothetical protein DENSPDRAFT_862025 [Dentipellis sp. KUC8613]|nr:hypothetical protein DENSPDRAFT_862025 [Dentipellis sp. KUC8613]
MATVSLQQIFQFAAVNPGILSVTVAQMALFHQLASMHRRDIILTLPSTANIAEPPPRLSLSLEHFLSHACELTMNETRLCWAVVYTLSTGAVPAYHIHLYCPHCHINYHNNFYVHDGRRIYYTNHIPEYLQVGEHHFVERRLVNIWIVQMLTAWTSASNCARIYNLTLRDTPSLDLNWQFSSTVRAEQVWDAFTVLCLLEDCERRNAILEVSHTAIQRNRFTEAIKVRNDRIAHFGQEERSHYCNRCTQFEDPHPDSPDSRMYKFSAVVIDGITIGHPRCAVSDPPCMKPLSSQRDRFCSDHESRERECSIVGCANPSREGHRSCTNPLHEAAERRHVDRNQALFQLKHRLQRQGVAHPIDSTRVDLDDDVEPDAGAKGDQEFILDGGQLAPDGTCAPNGAEKLKAQFGRKSTHNEQVIVAPCGIIIARATFFDAEAILNVVKLIKDVYGLEAFWPDYIFFDNNCNLAKSVKFDKAFDHVGLPVDVFHFTCKHAQSDEWCQSYCNPALFPELKKPDGSWRFNSSVAEQTNVWLGGYHAILREMVAPRYNFVLDELIMRRNRMTKAALEKRCRAQNLFWTVT